MKMNLLRNRCVLALCVAIGGLLLGGNSHIAFADGSASSTLNTTYAPQSTSQAEATIASLRQKIIQLQQQIAARNATTTVALTAEQLSQIQEKIRQITVQKNQLAINIADYVASRNPVSNRQTQLNAIGAALTQLSDKVRLIAIQVAANKGLVTTPAVQGTSTEAISAKIAEIKNKIALLTQQAATMAAGGTSAATQPAGTVTAPETGTSTSCEATGTCSAVSSATGTEPSLTAEPVTIVKEEPAKKGFFQSIWDFIKKLFTF